MISQIDIDKFEKLSPAEMRVLTHVCDGLVNKVIADKLCVSDQTVKFHVRNILKKLRTDTRTGAAVRAVRLGILP